MNSHTKLMAKKGLYYNFVVAQQTQSKNAEDIEDYNENDSNIRRTTSIESDSMETKTETTEKVLEDIKAQYDKADQDFQKFSEDVNTYQSTLENLQAAVDEKYQMIHQLCYDLSKICSRFNLVDELHANIENMKQEARVIKNIDMRKNAENEIAKLIRLVEDLSAGRDPDIAVTKGKNHGTFKAIKSFVSGLWPSS